MKFSKVFVLVKLLLVILACFTSIKDQTTVNLSKVIFLALRNDFIYLNFTKNDSNVSFDVVNDEKFKKPINSKKNYRFLKLENEMEVFLISNTNATKSTAIIQVKVGSAMEPEDLPGLAHYLEHLLFINTRRYPELNGFMKFIGIHNGYTNAHTMDDRTIYELEIESNSYEEALDRFSSFFKDPLFDDTYTYKELMAIENEFDYAKNDDEIKHLHVLMELSDRNSLFRKFSFGNLETLRRIPESKGINVRDEVIKFYRKEYSSNRMILVLASNHSLDELNEFAIKYFSEIENKKLEVQSYIQPIQISQVNPFKILTGKMVLVDSLNENTRVTLLFPMKRYMSSLKSQDKDFFMEKYISSKRIGGIYDYLYKNNLIFDIDLGIQDESIGFTYFEISMELTKKGEANFLLIIESIFSVLALLKNTKPKIDLYEEKRIVSLIEFDYDNVPSFFDESRNILNVYYEYNCKPKDVLIQKYLVSEFDKNTYDEIISQLVPENMLLTFQHKNLENLILNSNSTLINSICNINKNESMNTEFKYYINDTLQTNYESLIDSVVSINDVIEEKYTKTKYVVKKLNSCLISYLSQINSEIALKKFNVTHPEPNSYISKDFSNVLNQIPKEEVPIRLHTAFEKSQQLNKNLETNYYDHYRNFFYYPTHEINIPKATFFIKFIFPLNKIFDNSININCNTRRIEILSSIFSSLISTKFSQKMYEIEAASYSTSFINDMFSNNSLTTIQLLFVVVGFSDRISKVMSNSSKFIRNFTKYVTESDFESHIQYLEKVYLNIIENPSFSDNYNFMLKRIHFNQDLSPQLMLKEVRNLKIKDFIEYAEFFIKYSKLQGFIFGNITPLRSVEIMEDFVHNINAYDSNHVEKFVTTSNSTFNSYSKLFWNQIRFLSHSIFNLSQKFVQNKQYNYDNIPNHLKSIPYIINQTETIDNLQVLDLMSLKNSKIYFYKVSNSKNDVNSVLIFNVIIGYNSLRNSILTKLLILAISDHYFAEIRTEKQLGYIVHASYAKFVGHISGINFIVVSSNKDIQILSENVLEFWQKWFSFESNLITKSMFDEFKESYIKSLKNPLINFSDINSEFFDKLTSKEYEDFNWREKTINFLNNLLFDDFNQWFKNIYLNSNLFIYAIQSSQIKDNRELNRLSSYLPFEFTRYNISEPLFGLSNIKVYNQMQLFNIE